MVAASETVKIPMKLNLVILHRSGEILPVEVSQAEGRKAIEDISAYLSGQRVGNDVLAGETWMVRMNEIAAAALRVTPDMSAIAALEEQMRKEQLTAIRKHNKEESEPWRTSLEGDDEDDVDLG